MFVYINYINSGGKSISWDQLGEMRDAGVDIESHTYYARRPAQSQRQVRRRWKRRPYELIQNGPENPRHGRLATCTRNWSIPRQMLEKQLGIKVNCARLSFRQVFDQKVRETRQGSGLRGGLHGVRATDRPQCSLPSDLLGRYAVDAEPTPKSSRTRISMMQGGGTQRAARPRNRPCRADWRPTSMITRAHAR